MAIMKKKILVYTALFGKNDKLIEPVRILNNIDYICITNNKKLKSDFWKFIYVKSIYKNKKLNRYYKINYLKFFYNYNYSIYIDSNLFFFANPNTLIKKYISKKYFFALPQHRYRNTLFQEIETVYKNNLMKKKKILNFKNKILKEDINWLTENRMIIRNHKSKKLQKLSKKWWKFYTNGITRDQVSFPYVCEMLNTRPNIIKSSVGHNNIFFVKPHVNSSRNFKIKYFFLFKILEIIIRKFFLITKN